jgi:glycosyltransferase involved in cell wall biosynthesis
MGTGPDQSALKTLSGNDPAIQYVGQMKPIHDAIAALDLFVFPSRHEALGSVLLETMLCQAPIIAADVGGIPDLIKHDITGLLCPPNDPETLACMITKILEEQKSRERLANAAYEHVKELSADAMAKDYMPLYTKITGYL